MSKKTALSLCLIGSLFLHNSLSAQNDSSRYDLGRIQLNKEFTQAITIKGSQLEKMPFPNLSDAINVWLYGVYSNSLTLVYVIDGNIVSDVNAWNIHDIENITLIQNSLIQVNGSTRQQQLVLITTKRNHAAKQGVIASAQLAAVSVDTRNSTPVGMAQPKSKVNFYHQYYLTAWQNLDKIQYGI